MENASKALIMTASILIGVIILSIGVYLFTAFGGTSKEIQEQVDSRVLAEFNNNFLKYQGNIRCTIHDIVNLAKFVQKTNEQMEIDTSNDFYIKVFLGAKNDSNDLTQHYTEKGTKSWTNLLSENSVKIYTDKSEKQTADTKYYTCIEVNFENRSQPNRVSSILFRETSRAELEKDEQ